MGTASDIENPWAGLASYEDEEKVRLDSRDPKKFCGREEEIRSVTQLVTNNIFVTLYGKSGIGKTSLLNAGVFPSLREKYYLPISIRLSIDAATSFQRCIVEKINETLQIKEVNTQTFDVVDLPEEFEPNYLWGYFARNHFKDALSQHKVFPVIALDQFEEVLRDHKDDAEVLLRQIAYLMDESHALSSRKVENVQYNYDFNFRFVISIREDALYRLEDSIDNNYLSELKRCRYRLRALSMQGAKDAILIPGTEKDCIEKDKEDGIAEQIIKLADPNKKGEIDTLLLSLLCARTFDKKTGEKITMDDLDRLWKNKVGELIKNVMEVYYQDAIKELADNKVRYIQDHLIFGDGTRKLANSEEVKSVFGDDYQKLIEGENQILHVVGQNQVELLHDQLGVAVYEDRKAFEERERKRKQLKKRVFIVVAIVMVLALIPFFFQYVKMQELRIEAQESQSRLIAAQVNVLAEQDATLAARLAYEILPDSNDKTHPKNQYTLEADFAFRKALGYVGGTIPLNVQPVAVFPDGKKILARDGDNLCILDAENLTPIKTIFGPFPSTDRCSISQDGKRIATPTTTYASICIIDVESNTICDTISGLLEFSINPTGTYIVGSKGEKVYIYNQEGICDDTISLPSWVHYVSYSPSGKWIITSCNEGIFIWDNQTRKCIDTILGKYETKYNRLHDRAIFDQNEKTIATWSRFDGQGIVFWNWNSNTAKSDSIKIPNIENIESVSFSPNGTYFVTQGYVSNSVEKGLYVYENYIHLWTKYSNHPIKTISNKMFQRIALTSFPSNDRILFFYKDDEDVDYAQINYLDYENGFYNTFKVHNTLTYQDLYTHYSSNFISSIISTATFSPDGQIVLAAANGCLISIDVQTGDTKTQILPKGVSCASYSPDGNFIAYISFDSILYVSDSSGKVFERKLDKEFRYVSFSPDSKSVILTTKGRSHQGIECSTFWDFRIEKCIRTIPSFSEMCFNHYATDAVVTNGRIDAISSKNFLHIRDRKHSKYVSYYPTPPGTVVFSPDDKYLASISTGGISVWKYKDIKSLTNKDKRYKPSHDSLIKPWLFIKGSFWTLNYSPNGKFLLATSSSGTHIFDAYRGIELCKLQGLEASFSPDGKKILSVVNGNVIRIYDFPPLQDLIDQTRERFKNRSLTPEERRMYYLE